MRGPTLPFAPTKTYSPISVDLREKQFFSFLSLSFLLFSLSASPPPPFLYFLHLFDFFFLFDFFPLFSLFLSFFLAFPSHTRMVPKVGNFLPTSSFATCHYHIFLIFFISFYFPHVTHGSMLAIYPNLLQHMAIMPCVQYLGFHVAST